MDADFFNFPYKPYDIQLDLMKKIWSTIDSGNIGIFESPTGTVSYTESTLYIHADATKKKKNRENP
jgi:Rad3-related DNA helicase